MECNTNSGQYLLLGLVGRLAQQIQGNQSGPESRKLYEILKYCFYKFHERLQYLLFWKSHKENNISEVVIKLRYI